MYSCHPNHYYENPFSPLEVLSMPVTSSGRSGGGLAWITEYLLPSDGKRPGRPTNPVWVQRPKVPMSEETVRKLRELAEALSTADRKVSPMQVAAFLIEEMLQKYRSVLFS